MTSCKGTKPNQTLNCGSTAKNRLYSAIFNNNGNHSPPILVIVPIHPDRFAVIVSNSRWLFLLCHQQFPPFYYSLACEVFQKISVDFLSGFSGIFRFIFRFMRQKNHLMSVFSIGIIVDGTIHFMSQHPRDRRLYNASPENAVRKAFARTGRAPLSATAISALGFGVFAFSSFQPNWPLAIWYLHLLFWRW